MLFSCGVPQVPAELPAYILLLSPSIYLSVIKGFIVGFLNIYTFQQPNYIATYLLFIFMEVSSGTSGSKVTITKESHSAHEQYYVKTAIDVSPPHTCPKYNATRSHLDLVRRNNHTLLFFLLKRIVSSIKQMLALLK